MSTKDKRVMRIIKMYVEELVNNGNHSTAATDEMKGPEIKTNEQLKKFDQKKFVEESNHFIGAQTVAWMIYNGEIVLDLKERYCDKCTDKSADGKMVYHLPPVMGKCIK